MLYDYEGWTPCYDGFLWKPYHLLCGEDNGTAFEAAGKAYYLKTLEVAKQLRPKARFGFYGMPLGRYGRGDYSSGSQKTGADCLMMIQKTGADSGHNRRNR